MTPLKVLLSLTSHLSADVRQDNESAATFTAKDLLSLPYKQILCTRLFCTLAYSKMDILLAEVFLVHKYLIFVLLYVV